MFKLIITIAMLAVICNVCLYWAGVERVELPERPAQDHASRYVCHVSFASLLAVC